MYIYVSKSIKPIFVENGILIIRNIVTFGKAFSFGATLHMCMYVNHSVPVERERYHRMYI